MFLIMSLRKYFLNKMTTNPLDTLNFSIETFGKKWAVPNIITNGAIATKKKTSTRTDRQTTVLSLEKQENKEHQSRTIEIASKLFNLDQLNYPLIKELGVV